MTTAEMPDAKLLSYVNLHEVFAQRDPDSAGLPSNGPTSKTFGSSSRKARSWGGSRSTTALSRSSTMWGRTSCWRRTAWST